MDRQAEQLKDTVELMGMNREGQCGSSKKVALSLDSQGQIWRSMFQWYFKEGDNEIQLTIDN